MNEFVELKLSRGTEMFNVSGILRVVPAGTESRVFLFGIAHPVEIKQSYEEVCKIVRGE